MIFYLSKTILGDLKMKKIYVLMLVSMFLLVTLQSISAEVEKSDITASIEKEESLTDGKVAVSLVANTIMCDIYFSDDWYNPGDVVYVEPGSHYLMANIFLDPDDYEGITWKGSPSGNIYIYHPKARDTWTEVSGPGTISLFVHNARDVNVMNTQDTQQ
jgi:hypothetical protein